VGAELPRPAGGSHDSCVARQAGWGWTDPGLVILGGLYFSASWPCPGSDEAESLCYVSPKNPISSRRHRQRPRGQRTGAGLRHPAQGGARAGPTVAPTAKPEPKTKHWHCPMHRKIVRMLRQMPHIGMDLVPMHEERPRPRRSGSGAPRLRRRAQDQVLGVAMDPGYVRTAGKAPAAWTWSGL